MQKNLIGRSCHVISKYDILKWLEEHESDKSIDKHTFRVIMDMIKDLDDGSEG